MHKLRVRIGERSYDIVIGPGLIKKTGALLIKVKPGKDAVVVTNRAIFKMYAKALIPALKKAGFSVKFELVPDSEKAKSSKIATSLIDRIAAYDKYKRIFLIALGGGVVGDLTGFVSSIYKRGVPYIQIPTTLLAQVDSSIGGKTAIDLSVAKNMAGAFYQPKIVISDISLLRSLSARQLKSGLAEIIKYGVIRDRKLFEFIENNYAKILKRDLRSLGRVIASSSGIKARVVEKDEFDKKGIRAILNYGHTVGHAIETASAYSGKYDHGEAVAIGMVASARIAEKLGMLSSRDAFRIETLIEKCGLPTKVKGLKLHAIYNALLHDKKFVNGKARMVLPVAIGKVKVVDNVPERVIKEVLGLYIIK